MAGVRLNAYLARAGVASRRGADELIKAGRVTVNGAPGELNTFVGERRRRRGRRPRVANSGSRTFCCTSRAGTITTARDPQGRPTVVDLVGGEARVVPVGRLDVDTTGALLLTNDGPLAHRLAHPRYRVEKVYVADVEGEPDGRRRCAGSPTASSSTTADGARAGEATRPVASRARRCTRAGTGRSGGCARPSAIRCASCTARATRGSGLGGLAPGEWRELTSGRGRLAPSSRRPVGSSATRTRRAWRGSRTGDEREPLVSSTASPSPVICHTAIAVSASAPM